MLAGPANVLTECWLALQALALAERSLNEKPLQCLPLDGCRQCGTFLLVTCQSRAMGSRTCQVASPGRVSGPCPCAPVSADPGKDVQEGTQNSKRRAKTLASKDSYTPRRRPNKTKPDETYIPKLLRSRLCSPKSIPGAPGGNKLYDL